MKIFISELMRGKGIMRALLYDILPLHAHLMRLPIADFACGKDPGYWRVLGIADKKGKDLIAIDAIPLSCPDILHDINNPPIPVPKEAFKTVFLMNCLHIFTAPSIPLCEAYRVLMKKGLLFATFPLISPYIPEPRDFGRFTEDHARTLLHEAGFSIRMFIPLGGRFSSALYLISPFLRPYIVWAAPLGVIAYFLDMVAEYCFPHFHPAPLSYLVIAEKT